MKIAIIGAGASGMTAAITAAASGVNQVLLFERQARVGRKLAATGNGRCNLTNRKTNPSRYHGNSPDFVRPALEAFPPETVLDFFQTLGLYTVTESDGKVYPYSDQANSVVDVLRFALNRRNLQLNSGVEIVSVKKSAAAFRLKSSDGQSWESDALIVACGGAAQPRTSLHEAFPRSGAAQNRPCPGAGLKRRPRKRGLEADGQRRLARGNLGRGSIH